jgi:hypothetical protein
MILNCIVSIKRVLGLQNEPQNAHGAFCIQSMISKALLGLITSSDDPQKIERTNGKAPALNLCVGFVTRTTTQHKMQMTFKCKNKLKKSHPVYDQTQGCFRSR